MSSSLLQALGKCLPDYLICLLPLILFSSVELPWSIIYLVSWLFSPLDHKFCEDRSFLLFVCLLVFGLFCSLILFTVLFTEYLEQCLARLEFSTRTCRMKELIKLSYFLQADVQHLLISETATFNFLQDQLMRHSQCYGRAEVAKHKM